MSPDLITDQARADIQGIVTSGYGHLPVAAYLFVHIDRADAARQWLEHLWPLITTASPWPKDAAGAPVKPAVAVNVGFTATGLAACGLPASVLRTFPAEFQAGIAERARTLGDVEASDPAHWIVGGPTTDEVHALVVVHARDTDELSRACQEQRQLLATADGVTEIGIPLQEGYRPAGDYEPFGFHDGVSQPQILGIADTGVPAGEFILGYRNHYGLIPPTPVVSADLDRAGILPALQNPHHANEGWKDLGQNGTFAVYRKLCQDVAGFWQFMQREGGGQEEGGASEAIRVASKCIGRWPSGAPLVRAPEADSPALGNDNEFGYTDDRDGFACPIGAHIRRAHPRDDLKPYGPAESLHMSDAHRLLRRARIFGPPLLDPLDLGSPSTAAASFATLRDDGVERGIHFLCVNASIKSQFEFVQQTWCNSPRFGGLSDNRDPLVGESGADTRTGSRMAIPSPEGVHRTSVLPRFVTVRAGAYVFLPSLCALRFLAAG